MNLKSYEYYRTGNGVLYCGNCLDILPLIKESVDCILTDPVWPHATIFEGIDPYDLFEKAYRVFPKRKRILIQLGCDSDPKMISCIDEKFLRVYWLKFAVPGHKGRILFSGDVGYAFGEYPQVTAGHRLLRAEKTATFNFGRECKEHPCPRKSEHVEFLVDDFTREGETVLDPFLGSGTTARACEKYGRRWIGIELEEKFCKVAKVRIKAEADQAKIFGEVG